MKNYLNGQRIVFAICCLIITGCTTLNRATLYMDNHFGDAATYCSERFPVDTILKPGTITTVVDSLMLPGAVLPCPDKTNNDTTPPTVKCPDQKTITRTITRVDTLPIIDKAGMAALSAVNTKLNDSNAQLSAQVSTVTSSRKWWLTACLITWGILVAIGAGFIISKTVKFGL